ncbi:MAG: thioesterase family protein [Dehalococcoidia bacterium]|nr:thioesterase family protein [Dehalococcoidia bacterium]
MAGLRKALSALTADSDGYLIEAPDGWKQGHTLYGGITAALCAQVSVLRYPGLPPLRSAQFAFIGPAAGTLRLSAEKLREGRSATVTSVDCFAGDAIAARALFTHGAARESQVEHDLTRMPGVPGPADCEPFRHEEGTSPGFFHNFEMRLAAGTRPLSQDASPEFAVWVRHVDDEGIDPAVSLLALADAPPPAAMVSFPEPAPLSTMTWSIDLHHPLTAGEWFLLRSASEQSASGYSLQAMDAWNEEGVRVASGRQMVALFI